MKIYQVGGAVRDSLLGLPVQDIDYVVVGATPEHMVAAGYRPVGKDFPVFLHPDSHAEYALARTERKSAPGYRGFVFHCAPDVTLEQDLQRRDLTINAMATETGADPADPATRIIDPYHGQRDLRDGVFRHVSDAFAEDPVRILRVARFAARFPAFSVAPETMQLMRTMVDNGEVDALVAERVWQELARGLAEQHPSRMFEVLHACGALARLLPELDWPAAQQTSRSLHTVDFAASRQMPVAVRWAALLAEALASQGAAAVITIAKLCDRCKVPAEHRDVAIASSRELPLIASAPALQPAALLKLLERCDAFRRRARFLQVLDTASCLHHVAPPDFAPGNVLLRALDAALAVPTARLAQQAAEDFPGQPLKIADSIFTARVAAIAASGNAAG